MKFNKLVLPVVFTFAVLLVGCATPYQPHGFSGGYSETKLDTNIFRVQFSGNAHTGSSRTHNFALLRSAELTLEKGYTYFTIADSNTTNRVREGRSKPRAAIIIEMHHDRPNTGTVYNAQIVFGNLTAE